MDMHSLPQITPLSTAAVMGTLSHIKPASIGIYSQFFPAVQLSYFIPQPYASYFIPHTIYFNVYKY
jgi:hypothetical protein